MSCENVKITLTQLIQFLYMEEIVRKLIRLYNQNRLGIWIGIFVLIFAIVIIQLLNNFAKEENENIRNTQTNETNINSNIITSTNNGYTQQSNSLVSGGRVPDEYKNKFGNLINNFFNYCIQEQYDKAYELLSIDCKEELYPTLKTFEQTYCKNKFSKDKQFSFQSWTSTNAYVYRVKIFDDMLATGKLSSEDYIEDYVSVIEENGYKLNVNGYIGKVNLNVSNNNKYFSMKVKESDIFMEYSLYKIVLTNNSDNDILLDTQKDDDTVCLYDVENIRYYSYLYELTQEDLLIKAGQTKVIEIKFNNAYRENINIKRIVFSDIVLNYQEYMNNQKNYSNKITLKIEI